MALKLKELIGIESLEFKLSENVSKYIRDRYNRSITSVSRLKIDKDLGIEVEKEFLSICKNLIPTTEGYVYDAKVKDTNIAVEIKSSYNNTYTHSKKQRIFYKNGNDVLCICLYTKFIDGIYHITISKNVSTLDILPKLKPSRSGDGTWYIGVSTKMDNVYSLEKEMTEEELMLINSLIGF